METQRKHYWRSIKKGLKKKGFIRITAKVCVGVDVSAQSVSDPPHAAGSRGGQDREAAYAHRTLEGYYQRLQTDQAQWGNTPSTPM